MGQGTPGRSRDLRVGGEKGSTHEKEGRQSSYSQMDKDGGPKEGEC